MILGYRAVRPTGATRHRSERRWGRERLILQHEFTGMVTRLLGPHPDTETETWWRDATAADLSTKSSEAPRCIPSAASSSALSTDEPQPLSPQKAKTMPLSEENRALVERVTEVVVTDTLARLGVITVSGFTLNLLLNAARSEERAKAQQEGEGE